MNKTTANNIARHLHGDIYLVSTRKAQKKYGYHKGQKTYGYHVACGYINYTVVEGPYRDMVSARSESIRDMTDTILSGESPEWMTLDFNW